MDYAQVGTIEKLPFRNGSELVESNKFLLLTPMDSYKNITFCWYLTIDKLSARHIPIKNLKCTPVLSLAKPVNSENSFYYILQMLIILK